MRSPCPGPGHGDRILRSRQTALHQAGIHWRHHPRGEEGRWARGKRNRAGRGDIRNDGAQSKQRTGSGLLRQSAAEGARVSVLAGTVVLDLTRLLPGAVASAQLSDWGAEVIKIEEPRTGDYARSMNPSVFAQTNSGKKSVAIDLK